MSSKTWGLLIAAAAGLSACVCPPDARAEQRTTITTVTERESTTVSEPSAGRTQTPATAAVSAPIDVSSGQVVSLAATLLHPQAKAQQRAATVEVSVTGLDIVDPAEVGKQPNPRQGHLHYQLDNGPIVATTARRLSFHELPAGRHMILVRLAGNDHHPLGPQQALEVTIP